MKRVIAGGILVLMLLAPAAGVPAEEMQLGDGLSVTVTPPPEWRKTSDSVMFQPAENAASTSFSIAVIPFPGPTDAITAESLEAMVGALKQQQETQSAEVIDVAGTKAISVVLEIGKTMKEWQIQFYRDGMQYMITYMADGGDYDKWLPEVKKSLESFAVLGAPAKPASSAQDVPASS